MELGRVSWAPASGDAYARLRSRLPKEELEYAQALGTVALLGLALVLFSVVAWRNGPQRALAFVLGRVGVK